MTTSRFYKTILIENSSDSLGQPTQSLDFDEGEILANICSLWERHTPRDLNDGVKDGMMFFLHEGSGTVKQWLSGETKMGEDPL